LTAAADIKLFVVTPQLPSLHNAYALLKASVHRVVRRLAEDEIERALIDAALAHDGKARTIAQLVSVIHPMDPSLGEQIATVLSRFGVGLVGNQVAAPAEAVVVQRMTALIRDQLMVDAPAMGVVPRSGALAGGLASGAGVIAPGDEPASIAFHKLARAVLELDLARLRGTTTPSATVGATTIPIWVIRDDFRASGA
jgi:hypothetical protein